MVQFECINSGVWTIENLLPGTECSDIIKKIDTIGFREARLFDHGRHNKEIFWKNDGLRKYLTEKLRSFVWSSKGYRYKINSLSTPLEFYKYDTGDYIKSHTDASREIQNGEWSELTLVIYLNHDYKGGETVFSDENMKVKPIRGGGLLFRQSLVHEASVVTEGIKYVLRSDVSIQ